MAGRAWDRTHDPEARPLGCNGKYGPSGKVRHRYYDEKSCEACNESDAHYRREKRRGQKLPRTPLLPCGTPGAAQRHKSRGEPLDFACKVARAKAEYDRRHAKMAA